MEKSCYQKQMKQEKIDHFWKKILKLSIVAVNLNTEEISWLYGQGHTGETCENQDLPQTLSVPLVVTSVP